MNFSFEHALSEKFTLIEKIFRQINYLVIALVKTVKTLLSRNFYKKKRVRVNSRNFHNVVAELSAIESFAPFLQKWGFAPYIY